MISSSQNYFGVVPDFYGFLKVLACEQALLGVGGGRGKEERACNDVLGIFISVSKKSTQNADWWIFKFGTYAIALRVHLVDNTKMVESGFVKVTRISLELRPEQSQAANVLLESSDVLF